MTEEERESIMAESRRLLDPVKREAERQELNRRLLELPVPRVDPRADAEAAEVAPDWDGVDQRIAAALVEERKFILTVVGEAIGEIVAQQHEHDKMELTKEVERLWKMVSELQGTLKAYTRVERTARGVPLNDMKTVN